MSDDSALASVIETLQMGRVRTYSNCELPIDRQINLDRDTDISYFAEVKPFRKKRFKQFLNIIQLDN